MDVKRLPAGTHTVVVRKVVYRRRERKMDLALGDGRAVNAEPDALDKTKPRISGLN